MLYIRLYKAPDGSGMLVNRKPAPAAEAPEAEELPETAEAAGEAPETAEAAGEAPGTAEAAGEAPEAEQDPAPEQAQPEARPEAEDAP